MIYQKWMITGMNKPGKNWRELADKLGVHPSSVFKKRSGEQSIFAFRFPDGMNELDVISRYIEEPIPVVGYGSGKRTTIKR